MGPDNDRKKIVTKLVLCVSNFHFNRTAATVRQTLVCLPKDCKVSLKFSSDKFASKTPTSGAAEDDFHFDKSGLTVSYGAFMGLLLASGQDTEPFWTAVVGNYAESSGQDLVSLTSEAGGEDQPENILGGKKRKKAGEPKTGSKSAGRRARNSDVVVAGNDNEEEGEEEEDEVDADVDFEHVNGDVDDSSSSVGPSNRANLDGPASGGAKKTSRR